MQKLYNATKLWTNVPDMIMNYRDEFNETNLEWGYKSIITENSVTTIVGKPATKVTIIGTLNDPLKARLPNYREISANGCTETTGTCPVWLVENLSYWNGANDKYSINNNSEPYQNTIYGYWLLSSTNNSNLDANRVSCYGNIRSESSSTNYFGVRPVITVTIDYLSN